MHATAKLSKSNVPAQTHGGNPVLQRRCACGTHTTGGGECPECSKKKFGLQRKLIIGATDAALELEADRVTNEVTNIPPHSGIGNAAPRIQRYSGQSTGEMESAPASVDQVLSSPGRPLEAVPRQDMEQRFGYDFSSVRVHTDRTAQQSARDIDAHAYTVGHNIVFGAGQYYPNSHTGKRLLSHELAHVVQQSQGKDFGTGPTVGKRGLSPINARTSAGFGSIQRQVASEPIAKHQATHEQSPIVRVERYWHSTTARVFFKDGSNEEVTFIEGYSFDPPSAPERRYKNYVALVIDRSSPIRPRIEIASHGRGLRVKVETRPSPSDRIARLPANVQRQLSEAFLTGTDDEFDPQTMEFIADMGDLLNESSTTMAIQMEGRDPATLSRMKTVDLWVEGQKDTLNKVGAWRRGKFTQLLNDIRQIGVTGPSPSEDLDAQDIELVLAGVAGGQSDFETLAEFRRPFEWKRRAGKTALPQDAKNNPEFFIRNEYRRAWRAEAASLRKMSKIASAAQSAPFIAIGGAALIGTGAAGLEALGTGALDWAAGRGISTKLLNKSIGASLLVSSGLSHLIGAGEEAKAAGMDPASPVNMLNIASTAVLRTFGVGEIQENITNQSILTHQGLGRSPMERGVGGVLGTLNAFGALSMFVPDAPTAGNPSAPPRPIGKSRPSGAALAEEKMVSDPDTLGPDPDTSHPGDDVAKAGPAGSQSKTGYSWTAPRREEDVASAAGRTRRRGGLIDRIKGARPFYANDPLKPKVSGAPKVKAAFEPDFEKLDLATLDQDKLGQLGPPTPEQPWHGRLEGEQEVKRTVGGLDPTDIDHVENGVLWERKTAVNAKEPEDWVDKHITRKYEDLRLLRAEIAREYPEYERALIGFRFEGGVPKEELWNLIYDAIEELQEKYGTRIPVEIAD
jgi:Domain of unknown function (DUF4157)